MTTTAAASLPNGSPQVEQALALTAIVPWGNYRKTYDEQKLKELSESIKQHGVLQAIIVRPKGEKFELIVGSRRMKASKLAGLLEIPAKIRQLSDTEAAELQIIENLHREDVHPLEEAEAYEQLHKKHGYSVEEIAKKVDKSQGFIYGRMKLCALASEARKAFASGKLSQSTALLVARIPVPNLQKDAVKEIIGGQYDEPLSYRRAADHVQRKYMLKLADAPFDRFDADLTKAGSCSTCPKRTGNHPELYADVKNADVCTDPACFAEKSTAAWAKRKALAKESGQEVLSETKTKELFPYAGAKPEGFVELDSKCYEDPKQRTWGQLIGKQVEKPTLARTSDGVIHELVPVADARKTLKAAGHDFGKSLQKKPMSEGGAQDRARDRKAKDLREMQRTALAEMVKRAERREADLKLGKLLVLGLAEIASNEAVVAAVKRRSLAERGEPGQAQKVLYKAIPNMKGHELRGLAVELIAYAHVGPWNLTLGERFGSLAKFYGVALKKPPKKKLAKKAMKKGGAK